MFTGLIEAVGTVVMAERTAEGRAFVVRAPDLAPSLREGESIAVNGVCQTITERSGPTFSFQAVRATLSRTTLDELEPGRPVNLERALPADGRLGGHLVQGHVDGVAGVVAIEPLGDSVRLRLRLPDPVARLTVPQGSLAADGVSLTVQAMEGPVAEFSIIPYTWKHTALARLAVGQGVNVEADLVARYLRRIAEPYLARLQERTRER